MKKGFTLIELLVVIAIIGILASVVLVSFPGATKRAKDSRIVSAIAQARTVMTYIEGTDGDFDNFSCTHPDMATLCTEVSNNGGSLNTAIYPASDSDAACMYSQLNANLGGATAYYCTDSTGVAGRTNTNPGDATTGTCGGGANNGTCPTDLVD